MALGTITQNAINPSGGGLQSGGATRVTNTTIVGDGSYPTGGSSLTAAQLGLTVVLWANTQIKVIGAVGAVAEAYYDIPTSKLLVYTTGGQVANTTVLTTNTFEITAYGY